MLGLFFFNAAPTTDTYTLSLHDALPIFTTRVAIAPVRVVSACGLEVWSLWSLSVRYGLVGDRKSTRLNSSHQIISYAVFCLKKKNALPSAQLRLATVL